MECKWNSIITSFQREAHLAKSVSMHQHFEQFVAKQSRLERKVLGISGAELLRINPVTRFYLQGQCRAQFRLNYVLDISNFVSSGDTLMKTLQNVGTAGNLTRVTLIPGWHYPSVHLFASFHVLMPLNAEANTSTYARHEYDTGYNTHYPDYDVNFHVIWKKTEIRLSYGHATNMIKAITLWCKLCCHLKRRYDSALDATWGIRVNPWLKITNMIKAIPLTIQIMMWSWCYLRCDSAINTRSSYLKYKKRLLLRCIDHFKSYLINNMDHMWRFMPQSFCLWSFICKDVW